MLSVLQTWQIGSLLATCKTYNAIITHKIYHEDFNVNQAVEDANRVRWHSRRGMLELDVLLLPYAEEAYDSSSAEDQALYRRLLECEDPDLFGWFMEHKVPEDAELARMVEMVLAHGRSRKL